jgi:hypothetical protein
MTDTTWKRWRGDEDEEEEEEEEEEEGHRCNTEGSAMQVCLRWRSDSNDHILYRITGGTGQDDMNDAYYERLSEGHSDWV